MYARVLVPEEVHVPARVLCNGGSKVKIGIVRGLRGTAPRGELMRDHESRQKGTGDREDHYRN